jgi:hypothetical protein
MQSPEKTETKKEQKRPYHTPEIKDRTDFVKKTLGAGIFAPVDFFQQPNAVS